MQCGANGVARFSARRPPVVHAFSGCARTPSRSSTTSQVQKIIMNVRTTPLFLALASLLFVSTANADIAPACDMFADRVTCAQADLGKACATGGTCFEVRCNLGQSGIDPQQTLYKCEVCPPLLDAGTCSTTSTYGSPCAGDAGACRKAPAWCPNNDLGNLGIACYGSAPVLAPASASPVAEGGGCTMASVASRVSRRAALPSFLLLGGAFALFLDRRRRQKRTKS